MNTQTKEPEDRLADAKRQGQAQFDSILEMVEALRAARDANGKPGSEADSWDSYKAAEEAEQRIHEDALSVEVRSGWYNPSDVSRFGDVDRKRGSRPLEYQPAEYRILLCTGGPACQIVGELNGHCEPIGARMQVQDWFHPWTDFRPLVETKEITDARGVKGMIDSYDSEQTLLDYARCFWFGE